MGQDWVDLFFCVQKKICLIRYCRTGLILPGCVRLRKSSRCADAVSCLQLVDAVMQLYSCFG